MSALQTETAEEKSGDNRAVVLVANRAEIAVRIIRTARELGWRTVAVYSADDADSAHVRAADEAIPLPGTGAAAYLDREAMITAARDARAELIHPGYGFLSEQAEFARLCAKAGLAFVGPDPAALDLFGDKSAARETARAAGVPVLPAVAGPAGVEQVRAFFAQQPGGIMIKALAGGGGRGMREVRGADELDDAYRACAAEAELGFGDPAVYAEALMPAPRHIEVQVVAAPGMAGTVALALGDRDCSVQRRHQKVVEIAPAQKLSPELRRALHEAAVRVCAGVGYRGLATVEFLVTDERFVFLEVNPRIQVEHTVTEEVTGVDLVAVQFAIAQGAGIGELGLPDGVRADSTGICSGVVAPAHGVAVQVRVNAETLAADGSVRPSTGTLTAFTPPTGPGVRVDTHLRPDATVNPRFDSLLAKVIVHSRADMSAVLRKARAALDEFVLEGVDTTLDVLRALLADERLNGEVDTGYLAERLPVLVAPADASAPSVDPDPVSGAQTIRAGMTGVVVETAAVGATVAAGGEVALLEAMKMQHAVTAADSVRIVRVLVRPGQTVGPETALVVVHPVEAESDVTDPAGGVDPDTVRADLAQVRERHRITLDEARPAAVATRHRLNRRTARENIADLVDADSFVEYGALTVAAQRSHRTEEDLIANTPADGLVAGVATVGADRFGRAAEVAVLSYDYTVMAGTQGLNGHTKTDRIFDIAGRRGIPVVLFAEGGGGRPGDFDGQQTAGLDLTTFRALAELRGRVPLVAIVSGRCFAGNAALAGVCDVIIATPEANIGMGGPAMIEGGGLGVFRPEEIGPVEVQRRNGVIDIVADDEAHAVALARRYLSYFQGDLPDWAAPDPRLARHAVPENRLRAYDVRQVLESIADMGTVLELRPDYGAGIVTALVRVEGVAYGVFANDSRHLGGAIDGEAADKLTDFLTLCREHRLPMVSLCDTPGFMVGPEAEKEATVRRFGRLFVAGARMSAPFGMVILRKAYGLGAMAMAAGSLCTPQFTAAWPTGEIGAMGLEGAVRLGFRKQLDEIADPRARAELFDRLVATAYAHGKALTAATTFELDDVIDPADTRRWITRLADTRHGAR